jgi:hypothetical protein
MRGGSKLGPTVDPFVNIAAVNEVICDFFMQACDSSLHKKVNASVRDADVCKKASREPDAQRFLRYLHLGQGAPSAVVDSAIVDEVAEYNASNGLVSTSGSVKNHYVSADTDTFISEYYRDEDSLPNNMNWKYYKWCLPNANELRSL